MGCAGPDYGYFVNSSKSWLIVKERDLSEAQSFFQGTEINITTEGKRFLGAALGIPSFTKSYASDKIQEWSDEVKQLATIALSHPHAAYTAFTHGLRAKWLYLMRTIPDTEDLFTPLEAIMRHHLIPHSQKGLHPLTQRESSLHYLPDLVV